MNTYRTYRTTVLLLSLIALVPGCDESVAPSVATVPTGVWKYEYGYVINGTQQARYVARCQFASQSSGIFIDTAYFYDGTAWIVERVSRMEMEFEPVGDGYQRTRCITDDTQLGRDTTLEYFHFFMNSGKMYFYRGVRFTGGNPGLAGTWSLPVSDTVAPGNTVVLTFGSDSVRYGMNVAAPASVCSYRTAGDTIRFDDRNLLHGFKRFQVIPAWSLYVTTHPMYGFVRE